MENLHIEKIENDIVYAYGAGGKNIVTEIIPDAVNYVKENDYKKMVLKGLNNVDLELNEKSTIESAVAEWEKQREIIKKEYEKKHEEYKKSPKYLAQQKIEAEEKAKHDAYVYHSVDEALLALTEIEPSNLKSEKTTKKDAVRFCKEVMTVILKCEDLHFDDKQAKEFQDTLIALGCTNYAQANEKFKPSKQATIGRLLQQENDIGFPLNVFTNLMDCNSSDFNSNKAIVTEGGIKNSWTGMWLANQERGKEK